MHSSTFGKGWVGMSACPLVVLACESLHVCTVCIWRCEHARFCVEVFYALYINFHSFIHSFSSWILTSCQPHMVTVGQPNAHTHILNYPKCDLTAQFKMVYMRSEKPVCAPPHLSEDVPMLRLKWFQCSSD